MQERALKSLAIQSVVAMLFIIVFSNCITFYNKYVGVDSGNSKDKSIQTISAEEISRQSANSEINQFVDMEVGVTVSDISSNYLRIKKLYTKNTDVFLKDVYMKSGMRLTIENLVSKDYTNTDIIKGENCADILKSVELHYKEKADGTYTAVFDIITDTVYVQKLYEDDMYYYIELLDPHQVYDKIIVVDAGHGGDDTGTYSRDKKYDEKDINLSVVLYLKELMDEQENIKVYYTRLEDKKVYLNPRVNLANTLKADMFISVHCNASKYDDPDGVEVLYTTNAAKTPISSKHLAAIFANTFSKDLQMTNRGCLKQNEVYIVGNSKVPVVLIEIGFMSNEKNMEFMKKQVNRKRMAEALQDCILEGYKEIEKE
ncbi:MAG: N-acetylmuramoyl-L-alanine amidase [Lachnospiraceae bacterium]|nr:N-acetylmuramoyl-L-alanine amidase [Lachnospiraceae bacterium]